MAIFEPDGKNAIHINAGITMSKPTRREIHKLAAVMGYLIY